MEVMCTKCCGMISEENFFSEESGRPVAMQPVSGRNRRPESHATGIRTHPASAVPSNLYPDAPGARGVPGGFSTSGRTAASPNAHFFLADEFPEPDTPCSLISFVITPSSSTDPTFFLYLD